MAIRAIIEKLEDAPETIREHYRAGTAEEGADGKFVLGVESVNGWALEDVTGLKTTFSKEMTQRKALEREVARFKDIDPDKAREALTKLQELGDLDPTKEADKIANTRFEAAKTQLLTKHQDEIKSREERIGSLTKSVDVLVREQRATAELAEAKGAVELLLPHVLKNTRTVERDGGKFAVEVIDAEGNVRIANGKGDPMTLKDLVAEMRQSDAYARAFESDGHDGQGKKQDTNAGGPTKGDLSGNRQERAAYFASKLKVPAN